MSRQIETLPAALHTLRKFIPAKDYNRVRLALRRIGNPACFPLGKMRCLEMILSDRFWLCIDSCKEDRPVLAWTAFETSHRSALHEPVACDLRLFHVHAGLVMGEILENIGVELQRRLDALQDLPQVDNEV
ncbi:MAG: hypothetical protein WA970_08755 [Gammaproteobacteria bacterium]